MISLDLQFIAQDTIDKTVNTFVDKHNLDFNQFCGIGEDDGGLIVGYGESPICTVSVESDKLIRVSDLDEMNNDINEFSSAEFCKSIKATLNQLVPEIDVVID